MEGPNNNAENLKLERIEKAFQDVNDMLESILAGISDDDQSISSSRSSPNQLRRSEENLDSVIANVSHLLTSAHSTMRRQRLNGNNDAATQKRQKSLIEKLKAMLESLIKATVNASKWLGNKLISMIGKITEIVIDILATVCNAVKVAVKAIWDGFTSFLCSVFKITKEALKKAAEFVREYPVTTATVAGVGATAALAAGIVQLGLIANPIGATVCAGLAVAGLFKYLFF